MALDGRLHLMAGPFMEDNILQPRHRVLQLLRWGTNWRLQFFAFVEGPPPEGVLSPSLTIFYVKFFLLKVAFGQTDLLQDILCASSIWAVQCKFN